MTRYSLTDTAKLIRQALKTSYPLTKFSVRSRSYAGGSSIDVSWTDGPVSVDEILAPFSGATFDGMTDCKSYKGESDFQGELCSFSVDFVHGQRYISAVLLQIAAYKVHKETRLPLLPVIENGRYPRLEGGEYTVPFSFHRGDKVICSNHFEPQFYAEIVRSIAYSTPTETVATSPIVPELITQELIDATISKLA